MRGEVRVLACRGAGSCAAGPGSRITPTTAPAPGPHPTEHYLVKGTGTLALTDTEPCADYSRCVAALGPPSVLRMTGHLCALCIDANDPLRLARFWAGLLSWEKVDDSGDGVALVPSDRTPFRIRFVPTQERKIGPNQVHLHLTSTSLADQESTVARALHRGARHLDVGQLPEEAHVVLADPEGNEFCVIEPGNSFLAGCGFLGELACDGSQAVGYFWSKALGWPLVWDQDQETAIQSPRRWHKDRLGRPAGARRRPGRTGCTSTSLHPSMVISRRRSTVWSPSGRRASTSPRVRPAGWCWLTPMATSSVWCVVSGEARSAGGAATAPRR